MCHKINFLHTSEDSIEIYCIQIVPPHHLTHLLPSTFFNTGDLFSLRNLYIKTPSSDYPEQTSDSFGHFLVTLPDCIHFRFIEWSYN